MGAPDRDGDRWRCFVAVALSAELRERLVDAVAQWRRHPRTEALRWVEPDALHLTLAFLGDVDPERLPELERALRAGAAGHERFAVATGRLGAFSRPGSARVVWYGVGDANGALGALAGDVARALGVEAEQPYRPHVTLARARRRAIDLRGWVEDASASAPDGSIDVRAVDLMRSHLGDGPARYERLVSVELT